MLVTLRLYKRYTQSLPRNLHGVPMIVGRVNPTSGGANSQEVPAFQVLSSHSFYTRLLTPWFTRPKATSSTTSCTCGVPHLGEFAVFAVFLV